MNVSELYKELNGRIPQSLSCDWDKDGLEACPEPLRDVKRVLVSLDVTDAVIAYAQERGCDAVISHHPLFFGGLGAVNALDPSGARAVKLARSGISVMSFHTRLDAMRGGVNDVLASLIGLQSVEAVGEEQIMRIGTLERETDAESFASDLKTALSHGSGAREAKITLCSVGKPVKRVAVLGGSGGDDIGLAAAYGADAFVTGELKYHQLLSADDVGMSLICGGHFFTEYPVCVFLKNTVSEICPSADVEIFFSNKIIEI